MKARHTVYLYITAQHDSTLNSGLRMAIVRCAFVLLPSSADLEIEIKKSEEKSADLQILRKFEFCACDPLVVARDGSELR